MVKITITTNNLLFVNDAQVGRVSPTSNPKWNVIFYDFNNEATEIGSPAYGLDKSWHPDFIKFCERFA